MRVEPGRWTVADLDRLPASDGKRYELIAGELHVARSPRYRPQRPPPTLAANIFFVLEQWSRQTDAGEATQATELVFSRENAAIADIVWASHARLASAFDESGRFAIAPELVVEVLLPGAENARRDRVTKRQFYARHGVSEYWSADPEKQQLEVYQLAGDRLELSATLPVGEALTSPLLPGFSATVTAIFQ